MKPLLWEKRWDSHGQELLLHRLAGMRRLWLLLLLWWPGGQRRRPSLMRIGPGRLWRQLFRRLLLLYRRPKLCWHGIRFHWWGLLGSGHGLHRWRGLFEVLLRWRR